MKKRALISVSDKSGLPNFAEGLRGLGYEIVSTGGTARVLAEAGIEVTAVSEVTGFPEILGGRVKTLHPKIQGGILARQTPEDRAQLVELQINQIDLVVVNLYPFRETVAREGVTVEEAIENIDIGGPTMIRAAAKNFARVAVVVNPRCYEMILTQLRQDGEISLTQRKQLALEAFVHTASYDLAISRYWQQVFTGIEFPAVYFLEGEKIQDLRYGENPHQKAAFYRFPHAGQGMLTEAQKLQGKELSYNNLVDIEAAWSLVREFNDPAAAIIKHTNPCGVSLGQDIEDAYLRAYQSDPLSAFGGIVALNQEVSAGTAREMKKIFLEIIVAPSFSQEAQMILAAKQNLRLMAMGEKGEKGKDYWLEPVGGGFLLQEKDEDRITADDLKIVTRKKPTEAQIAELLFAWQIVKHVKSNAIVLTKDKQMVGVGAGQMNRVGAAKIALEQAGGKALGAALASDAYFPFADTVEVASQAGIGAIIQPGGSLRDAEVIERADELGLVMVFTGRRHFKH